MTRSARGLFRATGKRSKPVAVRNLMGEIEKVQHLERAADDFNPTPAEPTRAVIAAEWDRLIQFDMLWESAAGDGAMVREMRAARLKVFASDLVDRGCGATIRNFFEYRRGQAPSLAHFTNPPFNLCNWRDGRARWMIHALEELEAEYMALLLPWPFPGAAGLGPFWAKHPPARVYLMRWKIDFTGQGAPPMLNAWFIWDKTWVGETVLRMLDRADDVRQSEMFTA